ncbi:hypothetical protein BH18ACT7_BH18ACT7_25610 [soil metagenome]
MIFIKLYYPISSRVAYGIGEYDSAVRVRRLLQYLGKSAAIKDIITQNQSHTISANKIFPYHKSLGKAIWFFLYRIVQTTTPLPPITKQADKLALIFRSCNDQYLTNTGKH